MVLVSAFLNNIHVQAGDFVGVHVFVFECEHLPFSWYVNSVYVNFPVAQSCHNL